MSTIGPATTALRRVEAVLPEGWRFSILGDYGGPTGWQVSVLEPPFKPESGYVTAEDPTLALAADRCRDRLAEYLRERAA